MAFSKQGPHLNRQHPVTEPLNVEDARAFHASLARQEPDHQYYKSILEIETPVSSLTRIQSSSQFPEEREEKQMAKTEGAVAMTAPRPEKWVVKGSGRVCLWSSDNNVEQRSAPFFD